MGAFYRRRGSFLRRVALLGIVGAALLVAAHYQGFLELVHNGDPTHIVLLQGAMFVIAYIFALASKWKSVDWVADALLFVGLIGTVLGFIIALSGVDPNAGADVDQIKPMIANLLVGMGTALYTTLVGAITCLYLKLLGHVCRG